MHNPPSNGFFTPGNNNKSRSSLPSSDQRPAPLSQRSVHSAPAFQYRAPRVSAPPPPYPPPTLPGGDVEWTGGGPTTPTGGDFFPELELTCDEQMLSQREMDTTLRGGLPPTTPIGMPQTGGGPPPPPPTSLQQTRHQNTGFPITAPPMTMETQCQTFGMNANGSYFGDARLPVIPCRRVDCTRMTVIHNPFVCPCGHIYCSKVSILSFAAQVWPLHNFACRDVCEVITAIWINAHFGYGRKNTMSEWSLCLPREKGSKRELQPWKAKKKKSAPK